MASNEFRRKNRSYDEETKVMLFEGLNISQLAIAFGMDRGVVREKMAQVKEDGTRHNFPVWKIRTAAPYLIKPVHDVETYIRKMNHAELPKMLTKEFWNGQRARQEYELKAGDLWPTSKVIEKVGDVYKIMAMALRLMNDSVERQVELTEKQRRIIQQMTDSTSKDLRKKIIENFGTEPEEPQQPARVLDDEDDQEDDGSL
jgi:Protein of unknown function (DUF1441)